MFQHAFTPVLGENDCHWRRVINTSGEIDYLQAVLLFLRILVIYPKNQVWANINDKKTSMTINNVLPCCCCSHFRKHNSPGPELIYFLVKCSRVQNLVHKRKLKLFHVRVKGLTMKTYIEHFPVCFCLFQNIFTVWDLLDINVIFRIAACENVHAAVWFWPSRSMFQESM